MAAKPRVKAPLMSIDEEVAALKARFLKVLRGQIAKRTYNVSQAVTAIGRTRTTVYRWAKEDTAFGEAWGEVHDEAADMLEQIAIERGTTTSDILLIFMLKAMRPEKFRDQVKHELSGPGGGPIPFSYGDTVSEIAGGSGPDRAS